MTNLQIREIESEAQILRDLCLTIAKAGGDNAAHIGGALSCIDFIASINSIFKYSNSPENMQSLILSKGHACLSLYSLIVQSKLITLEEVISTFERNNSKFLGHPCRNPNIGISFSTGSLGNGLAHAAGKALFRLKNSSQESFNTPITCIVGDGECNEGIIWETLEFISKKNINNLITFVDCNGWQQTQESIYYEDNYQSFIKRVSTFEIATYEIDGHNCQSILDAILDKADLPKVIIGRTVKGKGFDIFENDNQWHHGIVTDSVFEKLSL